MQMNIRLVTMKQKHLFVDGIDVLQSCQKYESLIQGYSVSFHDKNSCFLTCLICILSTINRVLMVQNYIKPIIDIFFF